MVGTWQQAEDKGWRRKIASQWSWGCMHEGSSPHRQISHQILKVDAELVKVVNKAKILQKNKSDV
jgi:hypothetical protein